jgi:hypothetical protein
VCRILIIPHLHELQTNLRKLSGTEKDELGFAYLSKWKVTAVEPPRNRYNDVLG